MEVRSRSGGGNRRYGRWIGLALGLAPLSLAMAQVGPDAQELLRQQERERALREQQEQTPDVRLESPAA